MKKIGYLILFVFTGCASIIKTKMDFNVLNCHIIEIKEYGNTFRLKALNKEKDTVLIISLKEVYYENSYKKPVLENLQEIQLDKEYNFYVTQKKPLVSTMEQLGAFIVVENDTLWSSRTYKDIPLSFISHNTIGKYYSPKATN